MDYKLLKLIVAEAIEAPSGDNSQPWRFKIENGQLVIGCNMLNDNEVYNFRKRGSIIAIGALLENIRVISSNKKYGCKYHYSQHDNDVVVRVEFKKSEIIPDKNYGSIKKRCTDRNPYHINRMNDCFLNKILNFSNESVFIKIVNKSDDIEKIAKFLSYNERLIIENKIIGSILNSSICWTQSEYEEKKYGLYLPSLALKKEQEFVFKLLLNNKIFSWFFKTLGLTRLISKDSEKLYSQTDSFVLIGTRKSIKNNSLYLEVGLVLQKIWLFLTSNQISLQPVVALVYLYHRINEDRNSANFLTNVQQKKIIEIYNSLKDIFKLNRGEEILMLCRIGESTVDYNKIVRSKKSHPIYF